MEALTVFYIISLVDSYFFNVHSNVLSLPEHAG